jgi:hypothetical protein
MFGKLIGDLMRLGKRFQLRHGQQAEPEPRHDDDGWSRIDMTDPLRGMGTPSHRPWLLQRGIRLPDAAGRIRKVW